MFPQLDPETVVRQGDDPAQSKLRLFEAVLALLRIPAGQHGLLLVLEDLHWADASTRELLDYMTRRLRKARILLVGTYRTDELHRKHPLLPTIQGWRRAGLAQVIELGPLPPASVADMVEAIFDQPIREEFRNFLHARSEGNPFILEEMLKAAIDEGDIFRGAERWERKELAEMKLPDTVRETILLRVERLGEAQAVSGEREPERVAAWWRARGVKEIALTMGPEGCYASGDGLEGHVPAPKVQAVDGTGAGDAFAAGLLYGKLAGWSFADAVSLANAAGALATTAVGASEGVLGLDETLEFARMNG